MQEWSVLVFHALKQRLMKDNKIIVFQLRQIQAIKKPLKAVNHPANSGGLQELKLNYDFWYFLFWFWYCVCKDIQQIQNDVPPKKVFGNSEFWSSCQNHSSLNY